MNPKDSEINSKDWFDIFYLLYICIRKKKKSGKIKADRKTRGNDMFFKFDQKTNCKNKHIETCLVWFGLIYHTLNSESNHMKFNLEFVNQTKPCTLYFHFLIFPDNRSLKTVGG